MQTCRPNKCHQKAYSILKKMIIACNNSMQTHKVLYLKRNVGHSLIGRIMTQLNAGDKGFIFYYSNNNTIWSSVMLLLLLVLNNYLYIALLHVN